MGTTFEPINTLLIGVMLVVDKIVIACLSLCILAEFDVQNIIHKFSISSHAYLPYDTDVGYIERAQKKKNSINTVDPYKDVM